MGNGLIQTPPWFLHGQFLIAYPGASRLSRQRHDRRHLVGNRQFGLEVGWYAVLNAFDATNMTPLYNNN